MIKEADKVKYLRRYGVCRRAPQGRIPGDYETVCQGCGKAIRCTDDLSRVHLVVTKRGDTYFWHDKCQGKIWGGKIKSCKH